MRTFKQQAGDTIVEVMIAMAVASSVMGGAFVVVNRTLANSRQAQEHSEALQIANQQIEGIIRISGTAYGTLISGSTYKCIIPATGAVVGTTSAGCNVGTTVPYRVTFQFIGAPSNYFKINVMWDSVTGNGTDSVSQVYRPYQP